MPGQMTHAALNARVGQLQASLDAFRQKLAVLPAADASGFMAAMQELLKFVADYKDQEAYAAFEAAGLTREFRSFFSAHVLRFTWEMEGRTFAELAAKMSPGQKVGPCLGPGTWGSYARMGDALKLVDFSSCRRVVVLGCGRAPCSLFYLHDWTGVECLVGIDRDQSSLAMSRQLAQGFGLNRLRIVEADAVDFDYADFDVIYWGPFAQPRRKVMERIVSTARAGTSVILRDPFFTGTLLFEPMAQALDSHLAICQESTGYPGRFMLKHYLLRLRAR